MTRQLLLAWIFVALGPAAAHAQETTEYYGTDALSSIRVVFDLSGGIVARTEFMPFGDVARTEFMPFGDEVFAPGPLPRERFTLQERDGEASLDYFHARMFQPRSGRLNSVDPVSGRAGAPQTWNRYSYVLNNPVSLIDPSGRYEVCSQTAGAYWCPGHIGFDPTYVPSDNPLQWGYQFGGEFGLANVQAASDQQQRNAQERARDQAINQATTKGVTPPVGPDGKQLGPPVALPPAKNGLPNRWVPGGGTEDRGIRFKPEYPIDDPNGSQPNSSWDELGHFDVADGRGNTKRFLPDGTEVDHFNQPVANPASWDWLYRTDFMLIIVNPCIITPSLCQPPPGVIYQQ